MQRKINKMFLCNLLLFRIEKSNGSARLKPVESKLDSGVGILLVLPWGKLIVWSWLLDGKLNELIVSTVQTSANKKIIIIKVLLISKHNCVSFNRLHKVKRSILKQI